LAKSINIQPFIHTIGLVTIFYRNHTSLDFGAYGFIPNLMQARHTNQLDEVVQSWSTGVLEGEKNGLSGTWRL